MSTSVKESVSVRPDLPRSEEVLGQKWDRCLADTAIKMGGGIALGGVLSLVLFRRRRWPVLFGAGAGFGMGYANCQNEIRGAFLEKSSE